MLYQTHQSVRYQHRCRTDTCTNSGTNVHTDTGGTGIDVVPNLPKCPVPGIDVVPNLPRCPVPVLMLYRTYPSVRCRYGYRTELIEVSGTRMKVCTGTGGTGIDAVPNLPQCPVPVPNYRNVRCR